MGGFPIAQIPEGVRCRGRALVLARARWTGYGYFRVNT